MPLSLLIILLAGALCGLLAAEIFSLVRDNRRITLRCEVNMNLTEPDEVVTLTYVVQNTSRFPMPFVSFCFHFPEQLQVQENEAWKEAHSVGGAFANMYSFDACLPPHRGLRGKLRFTLKERGLYELGKVYIETGDFLGFHSKVRSFFLPQRIVCTARALPEKPALAPLGGFLGDISVRRFILEDPSLILGYRGYTGTEPMKRISWLQTARTGQLMVKNHDFTVDTDVAVLVDLEHCQKSVAERCLSLVRNVCDLLEDLRIPYAVLSNGDLFATEKGSGRRHNFEVQRRVGLSRFVRYRSFASLAAQWNRPGFSQRGCIVIAPSAAPELTQTLTRLESASGTQVCLLIGEEGKSHA